MRSLSLLPLLLLGCGRGAPPAPPAPASETARVLASSFPVHLASLRDCRKREQEPTTWVEVDDHEARNLDDGQFVPVVERRERGHFTDGVDQIRYTVRLENCQPNVGEPLRVEIVFDAWALGAGSPAEWRRPRPVQWREWRGAPGAVRSARGS